MCSDHFILFFCQTYRFGYHKKAHICLIISKSQNNVEFRRYEWKSGELGLKQKCLIDVIRPTLVTLPTLDIFINFSNNNNNNNNGYHHWCLRLYFQSFSNTNQKSVLKYKWLSIALKKNQKKSDLPTLISFFMLRQSNHFFRPYCKMVYTTN